MGGPPPPAVPESRIKSRHGGRDTQAREEPSPRRPEAAPSHGPGFGDVVRARVPAPAGARPGVLLHPAVGRGDPLQHLQGARTRREGPGGRGRRRPRARHAQGSAPRGSTSSRGITAIRIEDPKLIEDLEKAGVKYTGEAPAAGSARSWAGSFRSSCSWRSGASSSAGWAAPRGASCRSRAARRRSTPTMT